MDLDLSRPTAFLPALIDRVGVVIFTVSHEGLFAGWSGGGQRLLGYAPGALTGQPLERLSEGTAPSLRQLWQEVTEQGQARAAAIVLQHADGKPRSARANLQFVAEASPEAGVVGVLSDIVPLSDDSTGEQPAASAAAAERERIVAALEQTNGRKGAAAKLLGISRVTLWKKMRRYGLTPRYGDRELA